MACKFTVLRYDMISSILDEMGYDKYIQMMGWMKIMQYEWRDLRYFQKPTEKVIEVYSHIKNTK